MNHTNEKMVFRHASLDNADIYHDADVAALRPSNSLTQGSMNRAQRHTLSGVVPARRMGESEYAKLERDSRNRVIRQTIAGPEINESHPLDNFELPIKGTRDLGISRRESLTAIRKGRSRQRVTVEEASFIFDGDAKDEILNRMKHLRSKQVLLLEEQIKFRRIASGENNGKASSRAYGNDKEAKGKQPEQFRMRIEANQRALTSIRGIVEDMSSKVKDVAAICSERLDPQDREVEEIERKVSRSSKGNDDK